MSKITAAITTLAAGFTVAAIATTAEPASATFCIQWDVYVAHAGMSRTTGGPEVPDTSDTITEVDGLVVPDPQLELRIAPLPDPDPSIICLIIRP